MNKSGDDVAEDTPVPIPNTEVKLSRGEGSESRLVRIANCQAFFNTNLASCGPFFYLFKIQIDILEKVEYYINNCKNIRHEYSEINVERFAVGESKLRNIMFTTY